MTRDDPATQAVRPFRRRFLCRIAPPSATLPGSFAAILVAPLVLALLTLAPGEGEAQERRSSILALSTWMDSGAAGPAGFGTDADWAEVWTRTAMSAGASFFRSSWSDWGIGRVRLDRRVSSRTWLELGVAVGRSATAAESLGVRRVTAGAQAIAGRNRGEARIHDVAIGAERTTTLELALARTWGRGLELRGLVGLGLNGGGAYSGGQIRSTVRAVELSAGLVAGRLEAADVELAVAELPGTLEWYAGALVPTDGSSRRAVGAFLRQRSGGGESRTIVTLVARVNVR